MSPHPVSGMTSAFKDRLKVLLRQEKAAIAVMAAVFMTGLVGMVGLGVDLGELYAAKAQLQNAVDAAAMAGAATMIGDFNGDGLAETNYDGAQTTSVTYLSQNEFLNQNLTWSEGDVFTAGRWDKDTETFAYTGDSNDSDDLTAVQVSATRTAPTHFMQLAGINGVTISAQATAFVGWAKDIPAGEVDLPIAIIDTAIPSCSSEIAFNSENTESAQWTSFYDSSTNKTSIEPYVTGAQDVPPLSVGDDVYIDNGVVAALFQSLLARFNAEKDADGVWRVMLPVVSPGASSSVGNVAGFVYFVITDVLGPPEKTMYGHMECNAAISEGSTTGGADYGVRAGRPVLIN